MLKNSILLGFIFLFSCSTNINKESVKEFDSEEVISEAQIKIDSNKFTDALEIYARAIKDHPKEFILFEKRADLFSSVHNYNKAWEDYFRAGDIALEKKDINKAAKLYYSSALTLDLEHLKNNINSCPKNIYQKACDLGSDNACKNNCLNSK